MLTHKIETMQLDALLPAPYNPRAISDQAMKGLQSSVKRFGLVQPIVWNKRTKHVVGGHQRVKALVANGETEAAVVVVDLPELEEKALNIALNNPHIEGEFTNDVYGLLDELQAKMPDLFADLRLLDIATFKRRDLSAVLAEDGDEDIRGSEDTDLFTPDEVCGEAFAYFRKRGFPYPHLERFQMMQELNRLAALPEGRCVKSACAYQIADTFHTHRFHGCAIGTKSPFDGFHDDKTLERALRIEYNGSRTIKPGYNGPMSLARGTQACSNFRPAFAKMVYNKWAPPRARVFDPSTGYGGRLVGFLASHAQLYAGVDPSTKTHAANQALAKALCPKEKKVALFNSPIEDLDLKTVPMVGHYDLAFTSPPYFKKETYTDEKTNSCNRYPEYDAWKRGFLAPMLGRCLRVLRRGGLAIINIADVRIGKDKFPLEMDTVETARAAGFTLKDTLSFPLTIRMHLDKKSGLVIEDLAEEAVFVFEKPA